MHIYFRLKSLILVREHFFLLYLSSGVLINEHYPEGKHMLMCPGIYLWSLEYVTSVQVRGEPWDGADTIKCEEMKADDNVYLSFIPKQQMSPWDNDRNWHETSSESINTLTHYQLQLYDLVLTWLFQATAFPFNTRKEKNEFLFYNSTYVLK